MRPARFISSFVIWMLLVPSGAHGQSLDWVVSAGGESGDAATAVGVDDAGNSYILGTFVTQATFGAGGPTETILTTAGNWPSQDIFLAKYDGDGSLQWVRGIGGTDPSSGGGGGVDWGWGMAVDAAGNSYVTGSLNAVTTYADLGGAILTAPGAFIAKFNTTGQALWATSLSTGGQGRAVAIDAAGNSYVAGLAPLPLLGGSTATLWKIGPAGSLLWVRQAVPTAGGFASGLGVAVDAVGNSLVTGKLQGATFTFGAGEANETVLTDLDSATETFVASYDSNGSLNWAVQTADLPGSAQSFTGGLSVDDGGDPYVVGSGVTWLGVAFQTGLHDCWLARFHSSGSFAWGAVVLGNGSPVECLAVSTDPDGNSHVTGAFTTTATFGQGEPNEVTLASLGGFRGGDIFVAKYDSAGALQWVRQAGGDSLTGGPIDVGLGIAVDSLGRAHVAGAFSGSALFGTGEPNQTTLTSMGQNDAFVARYSSGAAPPPPPPSVFDLDIAQLRATSRVDLSRGGSAMVKVVVRNNGSVNAPADAELVGVQNGVEVYRHAMLVFDPVGNGRTTFAFPEFTPVTEGAITWTVTIADEDPDIDIAVTATKVVS